MICAILSILLGFIWMAAYTRYHAIAFLLQPLGPLRISGTVRESTRLSLEKPHHRLILDNVRHESSGEPLPSALHITFRQKLPQIPRIGDQIALLVRLEPLKGPEAPTSYDPRWHAFFQGIGASGFGLTIPSWSVRNPSVSWRDTLTQKLQKALRSPESSLACALITGDKGSLPSSVRESFAQSGLAHLLAISGLHISLVATGFFLATQYMCVMVPWLCPRRWAPHHLASLVSCLGAYGYVALSGHAIPAKRAWIMLCMSMVGLFLGRRSFTLRSLAYAALILLMTHPEIWFHPSFQLSFAAVMGLVTAYERNAFAVPRSWKTFFWRSMLLSTAVASVSTAPFSLFFFNRFTLQSFSSNLLAIPWTTFVLLPLAFLVSLTLWWSEGLIGLNFLFEKALGGLAWIADWNAALPGSSWFVACPSSWILPTWVLGFFWLCLWRKPWRHWGWIPLSIATLGFAFPSRPDLLIADQGKLLALRDGQNLWVSSLRSGKRALKTWQQKYGYLHTKVFPKKSQGPWIVSSEGWLFKTPKRWFYIPKKPAPNVSTIQDPMFQSAQRACPNAIQLWVLCMRPTDSWITCAKQSYHYSFSGTALFTWSKQGGGPLVWSLSHKDRPWCPKKPETQAK